MEEGLYHLHVKNIGRADGRSVVACAAYRAGEALPNELEGKENDFSYKRGVVHTEIVKPDGAPDWMSVRASLWNNVEAAEKRKDSRLAKEIEFALPRELPELMRIELAKSFAAHFVTQGCVVDLVIHQDGEDHNPHVHMLLTTRLVTPDGFGPKLRNLDKKSFVVNARKIWAEIANKALGKVGSAARLDHRSHRDRGIDKLPTRHRGPDRAERLRARQRNRFEPAKPSMQQETKIMPKQKPETRPSSAPQQTRSKNEDDITNWLRELRHEQRKENPSSDLEQVKEDPDQQDIEPQDHDDRDLAYEETSGGIKSWLKELRDNADEETNREEMREDIRRGEAIPEIDAPDPVPDKDGRPVHPDELERKRDEM